MDSADCGDCADMSFAYVCSTYRVWVRTLAGTMKILDFGAQMVQPPLIHHASDLHWCNPRKFTLFVWSISITLEKSKSSFVNPGDILEQEMNFYHTTPIPINSTK